MGENPKARIPNALKKRESVAARKYLWFYF